MFVSNKANTLHFNFDNIIAWKAKGTEGTQVWIHPVGHHCMVALDVNLSEFKEMFEEYRRLKNPMFTVVPAATFAPTRTWVTTAHSESGDDFGPYSITGTGEGGRPTDDELQAFWRDLCPQEFEDADHDDEDDRGPGDWGSYLFVKVTEV